MVEVRDSSGTPMSGMADSICMRVAPWIGLSAGERSEEIWAAEAIKHLPMWTAASDPFRNDYLSSPYTGLARSPNSNQLRLVTDPDEVPTQWFKDHLEWGFTQRPGGPKTPLAFRMPYPSEGHQPKWPISHLLRPNVAVFQIGQPQGAGYHSMSGNYGGNLGFLPRSTTIPNGRLLMGSNAGQQLEEFLAAQEYQYSAGHSFWLNVNWLKVGHIDEVFAFLAGNRVAVADSNLAITELELITVAQRAGKVFFSLDNAPLTGTLAGHTTSTQSGRIFTGNLPSSNYQFIRILDGDCAGYVAKVICGSDDVDIDSETPLSGTGNYVALWSSVGGSSLSKMQNYDRRLHGASPSHSRLGSIHSKAIDSSW